MGNNSILMSGMNNFRRKRSQVDKQQDDKSYSLNNTQILNRTSNQVQASKSLNPHDRISIQIDEKMEIKKQQELNILEISQLIENFQQQDVKISQIESSLKGFYNQKTSSEEEYHFYDGNLVQARKSLIQINEKSDIQLIGLFSQVNCLYYFIKNNLYLIQYSQPSFLDISQDKNEHLYQNNILKVEDGQQLQLVSQDQPVSVILGNPNNFEFQMRQIQYIMAVAYTDRIQLYEFSIKNQSISILFLNLQVNTQMENIKIMQFTQKGQIFYGSQSGNIKCIDYGSSKFLGIPLGKKFGVKGQQFSMESNVIEKLKQINPFGDIISKKVQQIAIDESRNILYALIQVKKNQGKFKQIFFKQKEIKYYLIEIYSILQENEFKYEGQINMEDLQRELKFQCNITLNSSTLRISSIFCFMMHQSFLLNLMILTQTGVRIYIQIPYNDDSDKIDIKVFKISYVKFGHKKDDIFEKYDCPPYRPCSLDLQQGISYHKIQKGISENQNIITIQSIKNIEQKSFFMTFFGPHLPALAHHKDNISKIKQPLQHLGQFQGRIKQNEAHPQKLIIEQIPYESQIIQSVKDLLSINKISEYEGLNDLAKQTYLPPCHYGVIEDMKDYYQFLILIRLRPIDILFEILLLENSNQEFERFLQSYGVQETACQLIQIICHLDGEFFVNERSKCNINSFKNLDSDNPEGLIKNINFQEDKNITKVINNYHPNNKQIFKSAREKAQQIFFKIGDQINQLRFDQIKENNQKFNISNALGQALQQKEKIFSIKIESLFLYTSRILKPIWNKNLINILALKKIQQTSIENITQEELDLLKKRVFEIRLFVQDNEKYLNKLKQNYLQGAAQEKKEQEQFRLDIKNFIQKDQKNVTILEKNHTKIEKNYNIQDISYEDCEQLEKFKLFIEKIRQAIDLFLHLSNSLLAILNVIDQEEKEALTTLKFSHLFSSLDGRGEDLLQIVFKGMLKQCDFNKIEDAALSFKRQFPLFFNNFDSIYNQCLLRLEFLLIQQQTDQQHFQMIAQEQIEQINNRLVDNSYEISSQQIAKIQFLYQQLGDQLYIPYFIRILIQRYTFKKQEKQKQEKYGMLFDLKKNEYSSTEHFQQQFQMQISKNLQETLELLVYYFSRIIMTIKSYQDANFYHQYLKQIYPGIELIKIPLNQIEEILEIIKQLISDSKQEELQIQLIQVMFRLFQDKEIPSIQIEPQYLEQALQDFDDILNQHRKEKVLFYYYSSHDNFKQAAFHAKRLALIDQYSDSENIIDIDDYCILKFSDRIQYLNYSIHQLEKLIIQLQERDMGKNQIDIQNQEIDKLKILLIKFNKQNELIDYFIQSYQQLNDQVYKAQIYNHLIILTRSILSLQDMIDILNEYQKYDFIIQILDLQQTFENKNNFDQIALNFNYYIQQIQSISNQQSQSLKNEQFKQICYEELKRIYQSLRSKESLPLLYVIINVMEFYLIDNYYKEQNDKNLDQFVYMFRNLELTNFFNAQIEGLEEFENYINNSPFWFPLYLYQNFQDKNGFIEIYDGYKKIIEERLNQIKQNLNKIQNFEKLEVLELISAVPNFYSEIYSWIYCIISFVLFCYFILQHSIQFLINNQTQNNLIQQVRNIVQQNQENLNQYIDKQLKMNFGLNFIELNNNQKAEIEEQIKLIQKMFQSLKILCDNFIVQQKIQKDNTQNFSNSKNTILNQSNKRILNFSAQGLQQDRQSSFSTLIQNHQFQQI